MRLLLVAILVTLIGAGRADGQEVTAPSSGVVTDPAIAISGQVSVIFDCGPGTPVGILHSSYADHAGDDKDSGSRIVAGLAAAARAGLQQAIASGAKSGRADVVAIAYEIVTSNRTVQPWMPVGLYVHVMEMQIDGNGEPHFQSRLEFIPDASVVSFSAQ